MIRRAGLPLSAPPRSPLELNRQLPGRKLAIEAAKPAPSAAPTEAPWSPRARALAGSALETIAREGLKGEQALQRGLDILLAAPELRGAEVSASIRGLGGKTPMSASHNPSLALNPASNSKLATATFALGVLGPEHRFETAFKQDSRGNLYAVGGFDPSLTPADLPKMARDLKASGVSRIEGSVLVDNSKLVGNPVPDHHSEWEDEDWDYLAPPSPLSVDKNVVKLSVTPGDAPGKPAKVSHNQGAFDIWVRATTVPAGTDFKVGCDEIDDGGMLFVNERGQPVIEVTGTIAANYAKGRQLAMKVPDAALAAQDRLRWALQEAGIEVRGRFGSGTAPADAPTVGVAHRSAPLKELLKGSIATSNAFDHEMYAMAASSKLAADGRTTVDQAMQRMNSYLAENLPLMGFRMENASGLGDANRLSSEDMVDIIEHATVNSDSHGVMLSGLARPGEAGTLKTRMLSSAALGRLYAKTGTLNDSAALTGYVRADDGSRRAFSMVINDYTELAGARAVLDGLGIFLASFK